MPCCTAPVFRSLRSVLCLVTLPSTRARHLGSCLASHASCGWCWWWTWWTRSSARAGSARTTRRWPSTSRAWWCKSTTSTTCTASRTSTGAPFPSSVGSTPASASGSACSSASTSSSRRRRLNWWRAACATLCLAAGGSTSRRCSCRPRCSPGGRVRTGSTCWLPTRAMAGCGRLAAGSTAMGQVGGAKAVRSQRFPPAMRQMRCCWCTRCGLRKAALLRKPPQRQRKRKRQHHHHHHHHQQQQSCRRWRLASLSWSPSLPLRLGSRRTPLSSPWQRRAVPVSASARPRPPSGHWCARRRCW
mmetsp:Transcript_8526/g.26766  ORF Transcript_8526/g.26766 Transcript_8526/m.26766 type:complete len:302 (-) Transcript_8526:397-1302(-)